MKPVLKVKAIALIHVRHSGLESWHIDIVSQYGDMVYKRYEDKKAAYALADKLSKKYAVNIHERTLFA